MKLTVGETAPQFSLPSSSGQLVNLDSLKGQKVVIFFYPKDDTPGCTIEACEFRDRLDEISAKGTKILGLKNLRINHLGQNQIYFYLIFSIHQMQMLLTLNWILNNKLKKPLIL